MSIFTCVRVGIFVLGSMLLASGVSASVEVVTVTTDHAWVAREIGGERVRVRHFLTGREDPHHISARPSLILLAARASLFVSPGMELDAGYTPLILRSSRNGQILVGGRGYVDGSVYVRKLEVMGGVTRAMGDVHAQGNPHYHLDPVGLIASGQSILEGLLRVDPAGRAVYEKRFSSFRDQLLRRLVGPVLLKAAGASRLLGLLRDYQLISFLKKTRVGGRPLMRYLGGWMGKMLPLRGKKMVTYHRQWAYFAKRFGLVQLIQIEPKPGIPPSARHLHHLVRLCAKDRPDWVVAANFFPVNAARFVSRRTGARFLQVPMHTKGTGAVKTYPQLLDLLVQRFLSK